VVLSTLIDGFVDPSEGVVKDDMSDVFVEISSDNVDDKVLSGEDEMSDISVVDVTSGISLLEVTDDESKDVVELVDKLTASEKPSPFVITDDISSVKVDFVTPSVVVLTLELRPAPALVISVGNVEVDSESIFSVVESENFVVDGIVGRVKSGGHGLSFVVLLIVGRVVKINECDKVLSELERISVDVIVDVSEVKSMIVEGVEDEMSMLKVEEDLLESGVAFSSAFVE
jgi:hypothetical protein